MVLLLKLSLPVPGYQNRREGCGCCFAERGNSSILVELLAC